jgi:hypothetical protein
MTEVPDWALADIPWRPVHQPPANQWTRPFTPQQLQEIGGELVEQFIRQVVLAVVGSFIPGNHGAAFDQLKAWADDLPNQIVAFINAATGLNFGVRTSSTSTMLSAIVSSMPCSTARTASTASS